MSLLDIEDGKRRRLLPGEEIRRQAVLPGGAGGDSCDPFVGVSEAIRALAAMAHRIATTGSSVLLLGETGTGKGVLASWLHRHSRRSGEPFVDLNCAGLSAEFLESELFGHERGSFTGAVATKPGLLEMAEQGTAFLDEIGDLETALQPKLLKVLEEKRFRRLGGVQDRRVDVWLIAATHRNLSRLVQQERFRADLYFRISTFPMVLPPLRERREDILPLAASLLSGFRGDSSRPPELTSAAAQALRRYHWPGNIRELRNVLERTILCRGGDVIDEGDLCFDGAYGPPAEEAMQGGSALTLEEVMRRHIFQVLGAEEGDVQRAAQVLGIPKSSLYQKIKKYGFSLWELKSGESTCNRPKSW